MRYPRYSIVIFCFLFTVLACKDEDPDDPAELPPSVTVHHDPLGLTELSVEALLWCPGWLADDLAISLAKQGEDRQNDLARLIVDADDVYLIDEIAFGIAHTSPEVLGHGLFFPELLRANAELIYAYDPALDYVELLDVGEPGVDLDYYTTTRYRFEDQDGVVGEETIDREIYYWYVVHPRLEDEWPLYLDAWESEDGVEPGDGLLWREFLWDRADDNCPAGRTCPLLRDELAGVQVVKGLGDEGDYGADANAQLWSFIHQSIEWGVVPYQSRPVQPSRIYAVGCGHCGEHTDLHVASARTALVPSRNVGASANDHTWGEWWANGQWWGEFGKYVNGVRRDRIDNDCDGIADDALDDTDEDGDGFGLIGGDCNDADPAVYPGATEVQNGYDDDCDGIADPGSADAELDEDGDGWSIGAGDCNDLDPEIHPDTTDPYLSSNRLYMMHEARGDGFISQDTTEVYGTMYSTLEFDIADPDGRPVDGAVILLFGTMEVYDEPDELAWAGQIVTDLDGHAAVTVGEYNPYKYLVWSSLGNMPMSGNPYSMVECTIQGETYSATTTVPEHMPARAEVLEADLTGTAEADASLEVLFEVESYRVSEEGIYEGSFSWERDGGRVDVYLVDGENLARFEDGDPFESQIALVDETTGSFVQDLPLDRSWYLLLANPTALNSTMVGSLSVRVSALGETAWDGEPASPMPRFQIPPGEYLALEISK